MPDNNSYQDEFDIYLTNVNDPQDLILFEDAIKSAKSGMYRSAYVLAWLCCAESLKHKFQIASHHGDKKAQDIYQKITSKEGQHCAVDTYILERAKAHGFINDLEYDKLLIVYKMRCVYAHPYKEAPSKENILSALSDITTIVLSKPAILSEVFIDTLIDNLINDINYLNDYCETVKKETQNWLSKINPQCYKYFINNYSGKIEGYCQDINRRVLVTRAKWVIEEILLKTQYNIYTNEEWHNFIIKYPNFSINLAINNKDFFLNIGERAQDYLISKILEIAIHYPWYLQILVPYLENKELLRDNYNKIISKINSLSLDALKSSGLEFKYYVDALLKELESCDYYRQNPTITFIQEKEQNLVTIDTDKQFKLGKLIHKAAYNNAWYAKDYINKIVFNPEEYPFEFLKGICSIMIEDSSTRGYIYVRDELLSPINLLIHNLENNTEIINYVNSLLKRYAENKLLKEKCTLEEIKSRLHTNKYDWIFLNTNL